MQSRARPCRRTLDITAFNRWRRQSWCKAPLNASLAASAADTAVFFFLAFAGSDMDWLLLANGDLAVKALIAALRLAPDAPCCRGCRPGRHVEGVSERVRLDST